MVPGISFKEFIAQEKEKMSEMTKEEKISYFKFYYLKLCIFAVIVLLILIWMACDIGPNLRHTIVTGGVVNSSINDEGKEFMSDKYLEHTGKSKLTNRIEFSGEIFVDYEDGQSSAIFQAELASNIFNYLIVDDDALDFVVDTECLADLNKELPDDIKSQVSDKLVNVKIQSININIAGAIDLTDTAFAKKYLTSGEKVYFILSGKEKDYGAGIDVLRYILSVE